PAFPLHREHVPQHARPPLPARLRDGNDPRTALVALPGAHPAGGGRLERGPGPRGTGEGPGNRGGSADALLETLSKPEGARVRRPGIRPPGRQPAGPYAGNGRDAGPTAYQVQGVRRPRETAGALTGRQAARK